MLRKILIPLSIVGAGALLMVVMINSASSESREEPKPVILTVKAMTIQAETIAAAVQGTGTVRAAKVLPLSAQVSGVVTELSDRLQPGGRFQPGEVIARIDARDYKLAVAQEAARVEQAELEFQLAEQRQAAAQREWEILGNQGEAPELAARKPQLEAARLALESARAGKERAELNLSRTTLRSPFSTIVQKEDIEVGQLVGPGQPVMTLLGTDEFWVRVSVPAARLQDIDVPDFNTETGSEAIVLYRPSGTTKVQRTAIVRRLEATLDPQARTATLIISIPDPLDTEGLPILPGAYVEVEIQGKVRENVVRLPASAVVDGDTVLIATAESTLDERKVDIGWKHRSEVFVTSGLNDGDRVIVTPVSFPIVGAPLSVQSTGGTDARQ